MRKYSLLLDLRHRLEYGFVRSVAGFVRLFPVDVAANISARVWQILGPLTKGHKRALENLAIAFPDKPKSEHERIAHAMWDNLGRVMVETMNIDRILSESGERIFLEDHVFRKRYVGKLGSTMFVSLHMGNWEIGMWPATEAGVKPAGVYRLIKNPYVDKWVRAQRVKLYPGGLFGRGRAGDNAETQKTARLITDYVRQGGRLGVINDLYDRQGIEVPFFGRPARTTPIPAMIVRRVGSRLWVGRCVRIGKQSKFRVEFHEQKVPRTANQTEDIRWVMAEIQRTFEGWIRQDPEQWMWRNRRWS